MKIYEDIVDALFEQNRKVNLFSRTTDRKTLTVKHVVDSHEFVEFVKKYDHSTILDVGCGGGFPGLMLARAYPDSAVHFLDATGKKIDALREIAKKCELRNARFSHDRAEVAAHNEKKREYYDVVTARAVADLPELLELTLPFVRVGGVFIAFKGSEVDDEMRRAETARLILGADSPTVHHYTLPDDAGARTFVIYKKIKSTPHTYPRPIGIPKKSPL